MQAKNVDSATDSGNNNAAVQDVADSSQEEMAAAKNEETKAAKTK